MQTSSTHLTTRSIDPIAESNVMDAIMALRLAAWAPLVPVPLIDDDVIDEFEPTAQHWAIFDGDIVAAAARLSVHSRDDDVPEAICMKGVLPTSPPAPIGFLSRLAVAPAYRGRGLSRQLDEIRIAAAERLGCRSLLALVFDVTGDARIRQLISYGFAVVGRGQRDSHPKFSQLAPPLVLSRVIGRTFCRE
jgi:GNAT superfamily N-acetyltransferase